MTTHDYRARNGDGRERDYLSLKQSTCDKSSSSIKRSSCDSRCSWTSLKSNTFEPNSLLSRIEGWAFFSLPQIIGTIISNLWFNWTVSKRADPEKCEFRNHSRSGDSIEGEIRIVWSDQNLPNANRLIRASCESGTKFNRESVSRPRSELFLESCPWSILFHGLIDLLVQDDTWQPVTDRSLFPWTSLSTMTESLSSPESSTKYNLRETILFHPGDFGVIRAEKKVHPGSPQKVEV
jgi:hypothetical protein